MKPSKTPSSTDFPDITTASTISTIGSYSLGKTIGEGSFGKVKLAVHNLTNVKVKQKQTNNS
jgi:serine/threonine protein kinase